MLDDSEMRAYKRVTLQIDTCHLPRQMETEISYSRKHWIFVPRLAASFSAAQSMLLRGLYTRPEALGMLKQVLGYRVDIPLRLLTSSYHLHSANPGQDLRRKPILKVCVEGHGL